MNTKKLQDLKTSEPIKSGPFFEVYENRVELFWDGVARYIIDDRGDIEVKADKDADPKQVEIFRKGSPLTTSLYMKGHLVLHGSCLEINGKTCGFLGFSGAGKSTTAMALISRGHKLISDDFLAFADASKSNELLPGLHQVRLWEDAAKHFKMKETGDQIHHAHNKFVYRAEAEEKTYSLDKLYILGYDDELKIEELKGFESLQALLAQIKAVFYIHGKREAQAFLQIGELLKRTTVSKLLRPKDHAKLEAMCELIEKDCLS